MAAIRLTATIEEVNVPYLERFLKGIDAREVLFEEEEDFFHQLTPDELKSLALAEQQSKLGMVVSSEEMHRELRERYANKLGNRG